MIIDDIGMTVGPKTGQMRMVERQVVVTMGQDLRVSREPEAQCRQRAEPGQQAQPEKRDRRTALLQNPRPYGSHSETAA